MAPARKSKAENPYSPSPFSSSSIPAISAVAVAQICLSTGYTSAEPAALRSLSSIASLYLQTLATSAASIAAIKGRSQSNLLDLIRALEHLTISSHGGFSGASDPTRSLLKSSILNDLRTFVRSVKEVPFPKPIPKREDLARVPPASFAAKGRDPPAAHVPRWLPCFPEGWERGGMGEERRERGEERRRWEEKGGIFEAEEEFEEGEEVVGIGGGVRGRNNGVWNKRILQQEKEWMPSFPGCWELKEKERELVSTVERERVRFELVGENSIERRRRKKKRLLSDDGEE